MYLGNPSLPISIDAENAVQIAENAIKERNWKDFSIAGKKIVFVPYYFFEYSTYSEKEQEGEKIVSSVEKEKAVLNPETTEIMEGIAEAIPNEKEMVNEIPEDMDFEVKKTSLDEKNAEKLCRLKMAEKLSKPIDKVDVMRVGMFYAPLWEISARIREKEVVMQLSAVNGQIKDAESLPSREKTAAEITNETLEELKHPKAWVKYSKELLELVAKSGKQEEGKGISIGFGKNKVWLLSIILLIVLIALFFFL